MVKQFFGRLSAYFISIFIFYMYFHLLSLYSATEYEIDLSPNKSEPFRFHTINGSIIKLNLYVNTSVTKCQLFNLSNRLPFIIISLDLIILLLFEILKIVCIVLLANCYLKRVRAQTADAQKLQGRYLLIKCILVFSVSLRNENNDFTISY